MAGYRVALIAVNGPQQPCDLCRLGYRCVVLVLGNGRQGFMQARRYVKFCITDDPSIPTNLSYKLSQSMSHLNSAPALCVSDGLKNVGRL